MILIDTLKAIEHTQMGQAMRGEIGWEWLFPVIETCHVIAIVTVYGSIAMVDLRLIGLATRESAVSRLSAEVLPYTWTAFSFAVITGTLMFMSKASTYFYNWAFDFKMLCIALAGLNMLAVNFGVYRSVASWDLQMPPPPAARLAGILSLLLWSGVVVFGRWIGFST